MTKLVKFFFFYGNISTGDDVNLFPFSPLFAIERVICAEFLRQILIPDGYD